MVSPFSDRANLSSAEHRHLLSYFQEDWAERLNAEQMFILIDGVLPFEACLYHQILPLFIEGSRLNLGMVSPDDTVAVDYVRRILSYMNYSLVSRPISSEALQTVLSAYLHQTGSQHRLYYRPISIKPEASIDHCKNWHSRPAQCVEQPDRVHHNRSIAIYSKRSSLTAQKN